MRNEIGHENSTPQILGLCDGKIRVERCQVATVKKGESKLASVTKVSRPIMMETTVLRIGGGPANMPLETFKMFIELSTKAVQEFTQLPEAGFEVVDP